MYERKMFESKGKLRIKQIMPIPDGLTVMIPVLEADRSTGMEEATQTQWTHLLALVDGEGEQDDGVVLYEMSADGTGNIAEDGTCLVREKKCRYCGQRMTPHKLPFDDRIRYTCRCSAEYATDMDEWTFRGKTMGKDAETE